MIDLCQDIESLNDFCVFISFFTGWRLAGGWLEVGWRLGERLSLKVQMLAL